MNTVEVVDLGDNLKRSTMYCQYNELKLACTCVHKVTESDAVVYTRLLDGINMYKNRLEDPNNWVCIPCGGRIVPLGTKCPICN